MTNTAQDPAGQPGRALRAAAEVVPAVLVLGALLYQVREVLSPLVLLPLLALVLWPQRHQPYVARVLVAATLLTALWLLSVTGSLLAPFVLALAFAYLLAPVVAWLERRRIPRPLAILLTVLPFLGAVVLLLLLLLPSVERQVVDLAGRLPAVLQRFGQWLLDLRTRLLASGGGLLTEEQAAWLRNLQLTDLGAMVQARWADLARHAWSAFVGLGKGVSAVVTILGYVVVTPVVTYYLLASWDRFTARLADLVPPAKREAVFDFLSEYDRLLGRYVRGQLTEATLVGTITGVSLALLGFPGALLVGVIAGLGNLVPYVGLPLSIIPGVLLALVSGAVLPSLLKLAAVFAVVQFIDGSITGPRIVGSSVGLNPVWVMIALVLFGVVLGFVGLLVAVPLAVLVRMAVQRGLARYRVSEYYAGAPEASP